MPTQTKADAILTPAASGEDEASLLDILDHVLNAGVVLPDVEADDEAFRHEGVPRLRVLVNGDLIDEGQLWSLPGGGAASVTWLEESLKLRGGKLLPGHLVLTSTPLGIHRVHPSDHVEVFAGGRSVHCFIQ